MNIGISRSFTMLRAKKQKKSPAKTTREQRSNSTKVTALNMLKRGVPQLKVAKDLKVQTRTLRRWKEASVASGNWAGPGGDGLARPAPRKMNPGTGTKGRKVTEDVKRKIKRKLKVNPFLTAYGLQEVIPELKNVSKRTIRRVIQKELKIPCRIAAKKPFLTEAQKTRRLTWAMRHRGWSRVQWARVLWSDETHIEQWVGSQQHKKVRRSSSINRYDPNFVLRSVKHSKKLMIWASFGNSKLGRLYFVAPNEKMNAAMYHSVLKRHLKRSLKQTGCTIFMQDGAPCHTAKSIKAWLSDSEVPVLDWVGQSCDCNPIENLWRGLKKEVYRLGAASNLDDLEEKIKIAWKRLGKDKNLLTTLTNSMTNRIEAVIAAKGDVTKY